MILADPRGVVGAINVAAVEGVGRVQRGFSPDTILDEAVSADALRPSWSGQRRQVLEGDELAALPQATEQFLGEISECADSAGFPEWDPNYLMTVLTTEDFREHPDSTYFRYFSLFAYWLGRTDFYYRLPSGRYKGLVLNRGDLLVMRQSLNEKDETTRITHGVGATGLRGFSMIGFQRLGASASRIREPESPKELHG